MKTTRPHCPVCGHPLEAVPCARCGGAPRERGLERRARGFAAQVGAGIGAPLAGLSALFGVPRLLRWVVPPTLLSAGLLVGALVWLWGAFSRATADETEVDLVFWSWLRWLEGPVEWLLDLPWLAAGSTLAFVLVAALAWWFGYAIVFGLVAGPFLARMHERAEEHWYGRTVQGAGHPFEARGLVLLGGALALGALGATLAEGALAAALLVAPLALLALVAPTFRAWFTGFAASEGRSAAQGLVVALVTGLGALLFLPFHLVPVVGQVVASAGAGFFVALGMLDLALERRGLPLGTRFALARRATPALVAFGLVSGVLFSVPIVGPVVMLPAASLGGAWLVTKLDKGL